jgi:hypothetical protein
MKHLQFFALLLLLSITNLLGEPATGHPRLWIREADLPRLRSWAVASNPIYADGLKQLLDVAKSQMDDIDPNNTPPAPDVPNADGGGRQWEAYPTELYAELFAFMSLIASDESERAALAQRARTLLMYVINEAIKGPDESDTPARFRDPRFYNYESNRARYYGEAYGLTVDWIYPYLSADDKKTIRTVFLRWADEIAHLAYPKSPEPYGVFNDPALLQESIWYGDPFFPLRWAGNNYFTGNMRNLGMLSMCFDPADDPDGKLGAYLANATGGFLYLADYLLRNDSRGGLLPEGFEYGPQTGAYIVQFLLALYTAGQDDPKKWGPQVVLKDAPFWEDFIPAYLHSLSPVPVINKDEDWRGLLYTVAWYGDGETVFAPDFMPALGPIGVYDYLTGRKDRLPGLRWIETYLPPGGADQLISRAGDHNFFSSTMFYFLLFDPAAGPAVDPRPALPLTFYAPGHDRVLARTSWDKDATIFTYKLGWNSIDHQNEDGNQIELYRRGEWLTKQRTGWGLDAGSCEWHNTLTLENDPPDHNNPGEAPNVLWQEGSQWWYQAPGIQDPHLLAKSFREEFIYVLGDATPLYNSLYEHSTDILHASRSVVWLKPDHIIVYDRAASATPNRFKRFWLNFPNKATVTGARSSVTLDSGQQVFATTLLPAGALITSEHNPDPDKLLFVDGFYADFDTMQFRLKVEAPGGPKQARFLHVIQGADAGATADSATLVQSSSGTPFSGAIIRSTVVLFPENLDTPFSTMTYTVPAATTTHWITGLKSDQGYTVATQTAGSDLKVTITPGGETKADSGGVLIWTAGQTAEGPNLSVARLSDDTVRLRFTESSGHSYRIEASTDLKEWADLGPATLGNDGAFQFDDIKPNAAWRFYRAVFR